MRIEFTERFMEYDDEEIDKAEKMGLPPPKGKAAHRRIYPRMTDIFAPKEIPGQTKYCQIEFYDGTAITVKGNYDLIAQLIDAREAQMFDDDDLIIETE
jgi:hypothetical protein